MLCLGQRQASQSDSTAVWPGASYPISLCPVFTMGTRSAAPVQGHVPPKPATSLPLLPFPPPCPHGLGTKHWQSPLRCPGLALWANTSPPSARRGGHCAGRAAAATVQVGGKVVSSGADIQEPVPPGHRGPSSPRPLNHLRSHFASVGRRHGLGWGGGCLPGPPPWGCAGRGRVFLVSLVSLVTAGNGLGSPPLPPQGLVCDSAARALGAAGGQRRPGKGQGNQPGPVNPPHPPLTQQARPV